MSHVLTLPNELTICTVGELRPSWMAWLAALQADASDPQFDEICLAQGGAVDEVDAAGVQLLLALSNGLEQAHLTLRLVDPSGALTRACEALGVTRLLRGESTEMAA